MQPKRGMTSSLDKYIAMTFESILQKEDLDVTKSAQQKLLEIIKNSDSPNAAIRIYVAGGGCSGLTYGMTFTDKVTAYDTQRKFDFDVLVDVVSLHYLRGAQIDFVTDVGQERFIFNNIFQSVGGTGGCQGCGGAQ